MLKIIGSLLVFISSVIAGHLASSGLKHRLKILYEIKDNLQFISAEISARMTPLPDIYTQLSKKEGILKNLWQYVARECEDSYDTMNLIWLRAIDKYMDTVDERSILQSVGCFLGRFDADEELKAIDQTSALIEKRITESEKTVKEKAVLYSKLSIAAGLFILILLL